MGSLWCKCSVSKGCGWILEVKRELQTLYLPASVPVSALHPGVTKLWRICWNVTQHRLNGVSSNEDVYEDVYSANLGSKFWDSIQIFDSPKEWILNVSTSHVLASKHSIQHSTSGGDASVSGCLDGFDCTKDYCPEQDQSFFGCWGGRRNTRWRLNRAVLTGVVCLSLQLRCNLTLPTMQRDEPLVFSNSSNAQAFVLRLILWSVVQRMRLFSFTFYTANPIQSSVSSSSLKRKCLFLQFTNDDRSSAP